ncbi:MAG: Uma2 family endonuclease [Isosphaeraceae bacterium]|nr:Uma2 family endonuclease [Isosphaeraceae bacterium]
MATAEQVMAETLEPESRVLIPCVDWSTYENTLTLWGDHPSIRLTYDCGTLEIMSPSPEHDEWAQRVGLLITLVAAGTRIPCRSLGTTTWRKEAKKRGLEADASFYLENFRRVRGKKKLDLSVDPPPDLAVEVEISRSAMSRMDIYASLSVPEVWRFDGERLSVWQLQPNGSYTEVTTSPSFPRLGLEEVIHWLNLAASMEDLSEWVVQFQTWVRDELVPRVQAP